MTYNEKHDILEVVYNGDISLDDLIELGDNIKENTHLPRNLKVLTDATKANYTFSPDKIPLIAHALNERTKNYHSIKYAVIQEKPEETAMSFALKDENITPHYIHRVFCTKESALEWLLEE